MRIQEIVDGLHRAAADMNRLIAEAQGAELVVNVIVLPPNVWWQSVPAQSIHVQVGTPIKPTPTGGPF